MEAVYVEDSEAFSVKASDPNGTTNQRGMNKRCRMLGGSLLDFYDIGGEDAKAEAGFGITSHASVSVTRLKTTEVFISSSRGCGLLRSQSLPLEALPKAVGRRMVKISRTSTTIGVGGHLLIPGHEQLLKDRDLRVCNELVAGVASSSLTSLPQIVGMPNQSESRDRTGHGDSPTFCQSITDSCLPKTDVEHAEGYDAKSMATEKERSLQSVVASFVTKTVLVENSEAQAKSAVHFAESKDVQKASASGGCASGYLLAKEKCPPCGKLLVCGRRREMEDAVSIVPFFAASVVDQDAENKTIVAQAQSTLDLHFFGVYDGHGGSQASSYCMDKLHLLLAAELQSHVIGGCSIESADVWQAKWEVVLKSSYSKMDKEVGGVCPSGVCDDDVTDSTCTSCGDAIAPGNVGTTALVAIVSSSQIVVANCGDSRAILYRGGNVIPLSRDHKPDRADETSRIEAAGGRVICWDGYRVGGLLAVSRAIGDRYLKRYVISEPDVLCMERSEEDDFMILASDGLWGVVGNEYACEVARKCLIAGRRKRAAGILVSPTEDPATTSAATLLVKLAYSRGSKDNISVVVVDLKTAL